MSFSFNAPPLTLITNTLPVNLGGSGQNTLNSNEVLIGNGTSAINSVSLTNNTLLGVGAFGGAPHALAVLPLAIQNNITELSTITTGVWNATPIASSYIDSTLTNKTLSGTINLPTVTASQLLITDGSKNITSTNTIPSGTQDNITRLGTISNMTTPLSTSFIATTLSGKTLTTATLQDPIINSLASAVGGYSTIACISANHLVQRDLTASINCIRPTEGGVGTVVQPLNGQIPIGSTSTGLYVPGNITAGTNITVSNSANAITISANAPSSTLFTSLSNKTVGASTTSPVSMIGTTTNGSLNIPANSLQVGDVLRWEASGTMTTSSTATSSEIIMSIGSSEIGKHTLSDPVSKTNIAFSCNGTCVIRTIGASGTFSSSYMFFLYYTDVYTFQDMDSTQSSINTTISNNLSITHAFSNANAGNALTCHTVIFSKN